MTYDVVFRLLLVSSGVKWPNSVQLMLNCVISYKPRKSIPLHVSYSAPSLFSGCHGKPQLVLCFKHFAEEQVPVSEDFNVDSVSC